MVTLEHILAKKSIWSCEYKFEKTKKCDKCGHDLPFEFNLSHRIYEPVELKEYEVTLNIWAGDNSKEVEVVNVECSSPAEYFETREDCLKKCEALNGRH